MTTKTKPKPRFTTAELEQHIADRVIEMIETEGLKWIQGWMDTAMARNAISDRPYHGSNMFMTNFWMMDHKSEDPRFMTMKQIHNAGGKVIKGEKGIPIFFYGTHQKKDGPQELQSKADERRYRFARIWYVWNVSQCELPEGTLPPLQNPVGTAGHIEHVDDFCHNMGVEILHKPGGAFYSPARDMVVMPPLNTFHSTEQYYGTLLHELVHATGAKTRLNRESLLKYREQRPFEELVAELGSAMLCRELNISAEPREDNAAYIQSWCKEIRDKPNTILKAASAAGKAVDWLWNERNNTHEEKVMEA